MGSVYPRGDSPFLWLSFTDANGRRVLKSSGTASEADANKILLDLEARIRAERASGLAAGGPVTVQRYAEKWIAERKQRVASADDDEGRLAHVTPVLGRVPLKDVQHQHVRDFVRELVKAGELAPRTINHVYGVMRVMFSDAVTEGLIPVSPCILRVRRGELPKKRDKDPRWRASAIFERQEIEPLISDTRIPERQRMLYGIEFLCGVRVNEVTPRRWTDYDPQAVPLGKLTFATAWALKKKLEKETKTGNAREVPVHPTLAALLARWKLHGWAAVYGRPPEPGDLIIPARPHHTRRRTPDMASRIHLNSTVELEGLHASLELLGLRKRRQHDFRRTFMSLGQVDGARREVLETLTHDPKGDITSLYTTWPWPTKCEEVAKLNVRLREGQLVVLAPTGTATGLLRAAEGTEMLEEKVGRGGNRNRAVDPSEASQGCLSPQNGEGRPADWCLGEPDGASRRSNVATDSGDYEERARAVGLTEVSRGGK
jgi:integrase